MSSSLMSNVKSPASMRAFTRSKPPTMAAASSAAMTPADPSMRACACDPAISCAYSALSTGNDAPKRCVNSLTFSVNLPDHKAMVLSPYAFSDTACRAASASSTIDDPTGVTSSYLPFVSGPTFF